MNRQWRSEHSISSIITYRILFFPKLTKELGSSAVLTLPYPVLPSDAATSVFRRQSELLSHRANRHVDQDHELVWQDDSAPACLEASTTAWHYEKVRCVFAFRYET